MDNQLFQTLVEILQTGEGRPLFPPNPQARLEQVGRILKTVADVIERGAKAEQSAVSSLAEYRRANIIREQIVNLADISVLLDEFYRLDQAKWQEFNAEYISSHAFEGVSDE